MKSKPMSFFKKLEDTDLAERIGYTCDDYVASYNHCNNQYPLDVMTDELHSLKITDSELSWNISDHGLILKRVVRLTNPQLLFGDGGIVEDDAELGLAIVCVSPTSNLLETHSICRFKCDDRPIEQCHEVNLPSGIYRGNAKLRTVLYLANNPSCSSDAQRPGTILGQLDQVDLTLFDDRRLFPVLEVDNSSDPSLWWVVCNWGDIGDDPFTSEFVAICINRHSDQYDQITKRDGNKAYNPAYLAEVISSAMQTIVEKIKESPVEWSRIISGASFPEGTIADVVQYMYTTFNWDLSSPESVAKSIRSYVYSEVTR